MAGLLRGDLDGSRGGVLGAATLRGRSFALLRTPPESLGAGQPLLHERLALSRLEGRPLCGRTRSRPVSPRLQSSPREATPSSDHSADHRPLGPCSKT